MDKNNHLMEPEEINLNDWWRILIGEVPLSFVLEVIVRTLFVFLILVISMRLMGKRMAGQLNKNEMISLTTLAAAVGVPIQAPDRGLLPSLLIAGIVIVVGRFIATRAAANPRFESISQGKLSILVENSVIRKQALSKSNITRERLLAHLRSQGIIHLGEVKRAYLEAGGFFTVIKNDQPTSGLKIFPAWDTGFFTDAQLKFQDGHICSWCGMPSAESLPCNNCGNKQFEKPVNI
jgi:uncharacterized membrane protein YcaP (DUF421 family)